MKINLIEDNAGGLFIGPDNGPWHDVTGVQHTGMFAEDAHVLAQGETSDWTTDVYNELPMGDVVAVWENGRVKLAQRWGRAANEYLANKSNEDE